MQLQGDNQIRECAEKGNPMTSNEKERLQSIIISGRISGCKTIEELLAFYESTSPKIQQKFSTAFTLKCKMLKTRFIHFPVNTK